MQPRRFTPEIQRTICELVAAGQSYPAQAAVACGISEATFYRWQAAGRKAAAKAERGETLDEGERALCEFAREVDQAGAQAEADLLGILRKSAGAGTWQAAAWLLERGRARARYARSESMKLDISQSEPEPTPEDMDALLQRLQELEADAG